MADVDNIAHWIDLVSKGKLTIDKVPSEFHKEPLYLAAVTARGAQLKLVPEKDRTHKICVAALTQYPLALEYVPEVLKHHKDGAICDIALKGGSGWVLNHIPLKLRNSARCSKAVALDGSAIAYVPSEVITLKLARNALSREARTPILLTHAPKIQAVIVADATIAVLTKLSESNDMKQTVSLIKNARTLIDGAPLPATQKTSLNKAVTFAESGDGDQLSALVKKAVKEISVQRELLVDALTTLSKKKTPSPKEQKKSATFDGPSQ